MTKLLDDLAEVVRNMDETSEQEGYVQRINADMDAKLAAQFIRTHAAEIERNARDAERYRWLRDDPPIELAVRRKNPKPIHGDCAFTYLDADVLDQAIDTAMREGGGE